LPSAWPNGEVKGLMAKGGFRVNMKWENGALKNSEIFSLLGGNCRICTKVPMKVVETKSVTAVGSNPNPFYKLNPEPPFINNSKVPLQKILVQKKYIIDFMTEKGKKYTLITI
jgi:alpha-L-fucosidase 2